ncbi:hypothetical protein L208DRAFT_156030 [Tricholoma matsutake]|nr:hypothetical protein L208DRAFT_156030 [Tricholoma matsutake 945]
MHQIAHQTETIAQLRREAAQWKDQSRNWQEHFLRVEQERCALSSRVDSLVAERLQARHPFLAVTPFLQAHSTSNSGVGRFMPLLLSLLNTNSPTPSTLLRLQQQRNEHQHLPSSLCPPNLCISLVLHNQSHL